VEGLLNGTRPVGLAWAAILGFVRISTHRQILDNPLPVHVACETARAWLTTDAHLAALAIEHQAELHSTDSDFDRFAGLRFINPLA
jgi:hypothetical protein